MEQPPDLESLYQEAQSALDAKDFERARGLLKQILLVDENYRDASRLLAGLVEQQRRRWYSDRRLWGIVGAIVIVVLGVILIAKLPSRPSTPTQPLMTPTSTSNSPPASRTPAATSASPTATPSASPTSITLVWERLWIGQELERDSITTIVLDPSDTDILYVGTENAGIYKSIDGGISWQPVHNGLGRSWIQSIVIDPEDPRTVYAAVSTGGVYKTTDGGENWFAVNNGIERYGPEMVASLAIDPQDNQHLLFNVYDGLWETRDGGENWVIINDTYLCFLSVKFDPLGRKIIYAISKPGHICQGGILKSEDDGRSWEGIGLEGLGIDLFQKQILAINQQNGDLLYVSTTQGIYGSKDGGDTWQSLTDSTCWSFDIAPGDGNVIYCAGANRITRTTDGGNTWINYETPFESYSGWSAILLFPYDPETILLGAQNIILSNDGGETWEERSSGLGAGRVELTLNPLDDSILYLEQRVNGFLYRSKDGGQSWVLLNDQAWDLALDINGDFLYRVGASDRVGEEALLRSSDQGQSWEVVPWPMDGEIFTIATHTKRSQWLYITLSSPPYLYFSKDGGSNWEAAQGIESIYDGRLYFDYEDGDVAYFFNIGDAFRSQNAGETWEQCGNAAGLTSRSYSRLVVDPRDSNHLILATRGEGVSVSEDGCRSWQSSNEGLGSLFINTIAYDPNNPDTLYAGSDSGAYVSFNSGKSWNEINYGLLGAMVVYSIVVDSESNVFAATPYGIFKLGSK
jgi:photosystem II stability/assembly factor-like uncharacterized protein